MNQSRDEFLIKIDEFHIQSFIQAFAFQTSYMRRQMAQEGSLLVASSLCFKHEIQHGKHLVAIFDRWKIWDEWL